MAGTSYSGRTIVEIRLVAAWLPGAPDQPVPYIDWTALGEHARGSMRIVVAATARVVYVVRLYTY